MVKNTIFVEKLLQIACFCRTKGHYAPKFHRKIFVNNHETTKVFSLESFPLYCSCGGELERWQKWVWVREDMHCSVVNLMFSCDRSKMLEEVQEVDVASHQLESRQTWRWYAHTFQVSVLMKYTANVEPHYPCLSMCQLS